MIPSIHPGKVFLRHVLENNWSLKDAANATGIDQEDLKYILLEDEDITPEIAVAFEKVTGQSIKFWLNLQAQYLACESGNPLPVNLIEKAKA
ncbi:MAG: hypothetical protein JWM11_7644 [Planctomycetaceae bacterium]|nr:hypothetical protein [Planctomycetaceae bacterium]